MMIYQTKAIVMKVNSYGDTSLIVQLFTEMFGLTTFMIKGAKSPKSKSQTYFYQVGNILDIVMYYHPNKNFQIIKECQFHIIYNELNASMRKNSILLFSLEVMQQTIIRNAPLEDVFYFYSDFLLQLEHAQQEWIPNLPLFFLLGVLRINGYSIDTNYSDKEPYFHLLEGRFYDKMPSQPPFVEKYQGATLIQIATCNDFQDLSNVAILKSERDQLMQILLAFFEIHFSNFKPLKSLPILSVILN